MAKDNQFVREFHDTDYISPFRTNPAGQESLVSTSRPAHEELLDGVWHYCPDPYDTALRSRWFEEVPSDSLTSRRPTNHDFHAWDTMKVPACWNVCRKELQYYEGSVVFTRTFDYVARGEARVFLRFGGCAYAATVFLNGRYIGHHEGASTPFVLEVTKYLDEQNRLVVVIENLRSDSRVPGKNFDWFNYGGMHRSVELIRLPSAYVQHCWVGLMPGTKFKRVFCEVQVRGEELPGQARVRIPGLLDTTDIPLEAGRGRIERDLEPLLWSPEEPNLYDVEIEVANDHVFDRVGFREIQCTETEIMLNGEPIFLRGISMHEESELNGRALTEAEIRENFAFVKELGGNFARLAHYPHSDLAARIADEIGVLLWEEIPVYWASDFTTDKTYEDAENQLSELILRDFNRAAIVVWSVGNENPDTDARYGFMRNLVVRARELDSTRPISAACLVDREKNRIRDRLAEHLDIVGVNEYFGWYDPDWSKLHDLLEHSDVHAPIIITEFGGGALAGHHGSQEELFTEENQRWIYERQTAILASAGRVKGMTPWILYDFRSPRRMNGFQRGYNRKGLLSGDKRYKKAAFAVLKNFYRSLASKDNSENEA